MWTLRALNPLAVLHRTNAEIDISKVIGVDAFDLAQKLEIDPEFLGDHLHEHDATVGSFVLEPDTPIDVNHFALWINRIARERGNDLYRTKGILNAQGFKERIVFQSVRMLTTMRPERPWEAGERRTSQVVVIGRKLDRNRFTTDFARCAARVAPVM